MGFLSILQVIMLHIQYQHHGQYLSFVIVGVFLVYLLWFINFARSAPHTFPSSPTCRQRSVTMLDMKSDIIIGDMVKSKAMRSIIFKRLTDKHIVVNKFCKKKKKKEEEEEVFIIEYGKEVK